MASRGFLIRFIDIGLIVLFGFVMISDIEASSRVELSDVRGEVLESSEEDDERALIVVEVLPDGSFSVTDVLDEGAAPSRVSGVERLAELLRAVSGTREAEGRDPVVLIQPHAASLVQSTVDVMDVCDRLSLSKSLQMDITVAPPEAR